MCAPSSEKSTAKKTAFAAGLSSSPDPAFGRCLPADLGVNPFASYPPHLASGEAARSARPSARYGLTPTSASPQPREARAARETGRFGAMPRVKPRERVAWERNDLARLLAGVAGPSDADVDDAMHKAHGVIQRYIASLGYGVIRQRMGGAGLTSDDVVMGYAAGYGAVAMCGQLPIPSSGIDGNGIRYRTGASGVAEIYFQGAPENLRGKQTIADYRAGTRDESPKIKKRNMARCKSRKCLDCTLHQAEQDTNDLQWGLAMLLFKGATYVPMVLTLRHFHLDPQRQKDALRAIYDAFKKTYAWKRLSRQYGFTVAYKGTEETMDSLVARRRSGAHPHYHVILLFPRKSYTKKAGIIAHSVPREQDIRYIQDQLAVAWYDCIRDYYDAERPGWAVPYREDIIRHGLQIQLYPVALYPAASERTPEWEAEKRQFEAKVKEVKAQWVSGKYDMPDQCRRYVPQINNRWRGDKMHFYRQLAGLSNIAAYTGGIDKYNIHKEVVQGGTKDGRNAGRVNYFTFLWQCAQANVSNISDAAKERINAQAKALIQSMYRVRYRSVGRVIKDVLRMPFSMLGDDGYDKDTPLTPREAVEDDAHLLPRYIPGDSVRLGAYVLGADDYMALHTHGSDHVVARANKAISQRLRSGQSVDVAVARHIWAQVTARVTASAPVEYAGRGAPVIPDYILRSSCWTPDISCCKRESYKYQHILRLCKYFAPAEYRRLVLMLLLTDDALPDNDISDDLCVLRGDTLADGGISEANLLDAGYYSARAEAMVLDAWDQDVRHRILKADRMRRHITAARADIKREQARAARRAIVSFLGGLYVRGILRRKDIDRYMATRPRYVGIWEDIYGYYAIHRRGQYGGIQPGAVRVCGSDKISRADVELGVGLRIGGPDLPAASGLDALGSADTWWGIGYNPEAFDLDLAARQADILRGFVPVRGAEYVDGKRILARGSGEYADCVLLYTPGYLSGIIQRRRELEAARQREAADRLREATDAALPDVKTMARGVGWRAKDMRENRVYLRILARALAIGAPRETVEDALINSRHNHKTRKSRTRLISRLEREILWRALTPDQVCADCVTAVDWILPRWSAAAYERTGQYIDAAPPVPQEILPGLAG